MSQFCNTHVKYTDTKNRFFYVIVEPRRVHKDSERAIFAKLAKIRVARQGEFWDEKKWQMIPVTFAQPQAESHSRFMAFDDNALVFEERKPYISKAMFLRVLPILYSIAIDQPLASLYVELVKDTRQISEWLSEYEQVTRIRFERLRKPNPVDDPIFDKIKRHIDETKAKNMTLENKDDGLNSGQGTLIESGIRLCEEGYGEFEVEAKRQQEVVRRTSREFTLSKRIYYEDDTDFVNKAWVEKRRVRSRRRRREESG